MERAKQATDIAVAGATANVPAVADDVIDQVVLGIAELQRHHGLRLACEVGEFITDRFYGGDVGVLRERGPKDASLRKLAEHPDLPMSPAGLYRAVAIYEVAERTGGVATWKHLGPSHVRVVLPLPAPDQHALLRRAEEEGWTVAKLEAEARQKRTRLGGGRRPLPRFVKTINAMAKFANGDEELFGDLDAAGDLDPAEAQRLYQTVTGLKLRCEELQEKLRGRVAGFGTVE